MARSKPPTANVAPKLQLSPQGIERGIARLQERISELANFDTSQLSDDGDSPKLVALSTSIEDTLVRCFGENTSVYYRFSSAAQLHFSPGVWTDNYPQRHHYVEGTQKNILQSISMLGEAQRTLREDLADHEHEAKPENPVAADEGRLPLSRKVFIVHGHDEGSREMVARFLERVGFQSIILHEQANQGRTVMEKVEAHGEVGFAVVLLTPDDEGCTKGGAPEPRARQNVLLELGYFLGRLGRDKVCALKRGTLEIPSDFAGVVWESMEGNSWKQALGRELEAAGHEIDWNKVMRA
ncbi:TIR domain-containing protein [Pseudomonas mandelii]|uniref:Predicted nucleotide-binding protein containing TIR-like domain n=1 Tax=Pseudomonas mandelii TaxID=75612 RepID=A0ABY0VVX6_9PSED|nr:nucleotide-binding protein [Pseudomonas mandelii]TWS08739.1 nucleotide-binding protein [Pseudomonas mandelii]SDU56899.1 Predicted nucleotide-binding protein containing TIR-like domain [Pseudomonas mandelii]